MNAFVRHAFWVAPLITMVGFVSYFMVFARYPALRDFPWINLPLVLLGAGLAISGLLRGWGESSRLKRILHGLSAVFSIIVAGFLAIYVFVITYQIPSAEASRAKVSVGSPAPDFTLADASGEKVSLSDFRGKKVVLSFYRGFW